RRHCFDAIESNFEGLSDIFICLFTEADVAVADLEKAEIRSRRQRVSCFRDLGKGSRRKHPAAYGPKEARAGPCHAVEKAAAIDSVVFVVVRNVIGHNIGFWFGCLEGCLTPVFTGSAGFYSRNPSDQSASRGNFPQFLLCGCYFRRLSLQKRRAQALAHSAAFELVKYGQSPTYSLCAASAALARELISCRNCGGCPVNSPSAMKLLIAPRASSCPGPVGRMIAQAGRLERMNLHGSGMIRLACNVSG